MDIPVPDNLHRALSAPVIEMINDVTTWEATVMSGNKASDERHGFWLWSCDPVLSVFGSFCSLFLRGKVEIATLQPGAAKVSMNACMR